MKYAFLGNMNNMGFVLAREMKKQNLDVTLFIDADRDYILDRPESFDPDIRMPFPDWIIELDGAQKKKIQRPFLLFFQKKTCLKLLEDFDVIILNGYWISLGKFIPRQKKVIIFFAGFDLDVLGDLNSVDYFLRQQKSSLLTRILRPLLKLKYKAVIKQHRSGITRADGINYFPKGINPAGDAIIDALKAGTVYKRLALRGFPFDNIRYQPFLKKDKFTILNFTRFFFLDTHRNDNKRNDIMIAGIAEFVRSNKVSTHDCEIVFIEKGEDLEEAKKMCDELGISEFIMWKAQMSHLELNALIVESDVVFDQLGNQWMGYGIVAMSLGRPVIANGRPDVFDPLTGEKSPVCNAVNAKEVSDWLSLLYNNENKKIEIGKASSVYIHKHYDLKKTIDFIVSI